MKFLQTYENFSSKTIHIFDLDDTLMVSPSFEELVINLIKEDLTIKDLLDRSIRSIGVTIKDLRHEHGRVYVNDPDEKLTPTKDWVRKGKRVYLTTPNKFYYLDESLPNALKDFSEVYKNCEYKAIVTGRTEEMRNKILELLKKFNLEEPNLGLYCYPNRSQDSDKVSIWKAKTIINLIKDSNATEAYFYEDKSKWLKTATKMVKEKLPDIKFNPIKA